MNSVFKVVIQTTNLNTINKLLCCGACTNTKDKHGNNVLHTCAQTGDQKTFEALLQNSDQINATNRNGETPLHIAAMYGQCKLVNLLIEKGAIVNKTDTAGQTPLHLATVWGHTDVCQTLIDTRDIDNDVLMSVLYSAVLYGHELILKSILTKISCYKLPKSGRGLIHAAVDGGNLQILNLVLKITEVQDINMKDNYGITPLHVAIKNGCFDIVEILIRTGADVNSKDNFNVSCLDIANNFKYHKIVQLLHLNGVVK